MAVISIVTRAILVMETCVSATPITITTLQLSMILKK